MSVLTSAGLCMAHGFSGAARIWLSLGLLMAGTGHVFACMSKGCGQPASACSAHCLSSVVFKVELMPRAKLSLAELRADLRAPSQDSVSPHKPSFLG